MKTPFFKSRTAFKKTGIFSPFGVVLAFAASLSGCKKDVSDLGVVQVGQTEAAIPTPTFDWETADHMPTPPGATPILVPWASGSNQLFPADIAFDHKKKDGWNMVYNTFGTTHMTSPSFFALYNKYNGILRFYLYMPPGTPVPSSYFSDGLSVSGTHPTTLLNFSKDVVEAGGVIPGGRVWSPYANAVASITRVQNYQLQSTGAWYACQYEMAYDPNIANATQDNLNFVWNLATTNISKVELNGEENGRLSGTIGTGSPGGFNIGSLFGKAVEGAVYAAGLHGVGKLEIGNKDMEKAITDGAKSGLAGAVKGFLSAILGGSPSSPELVNLTLKTEIKLKGALSSNSGIANPSLAVPGTKSGKNTVGYLPSYDKALGVVHLRYPPDVTAKIDSAGNSVRVGRSRSRRKYPIRYYKHFNHEFSYTHDHSNIVYNPEVLKDGTTIKLLRSDVIVPYTVNTERINAWPNSSTMYSENVSFDENFGLPAYHAKESIGANGYMVGGNQNSNVKFKIVGYLSTYLRSYYDDITDNIDYQNTAVRYTFLVTPPNGGKKYTIVKTFKAKLLLPNSRVRNPVQNRPSRTPSRTR